MKSNFVLAIALSFAVLVVWEIFVMRPQRIAAQKASQERALAAAQQKPRSSETLSHNTQSPGPSSAAANTVPMPSPMMARERIVEMDFGKNRMAFNVFGASVHQWWFQEENAEGRLTPLVPENDLNLRPLDTFPDIEFSITREGPQKIVFEGKRNDGLAVKKTLQLSDDNIHELSITVKNEGAESVDGSYAIGWGPGIASGQDIDEKISQRAQRALAFDQPRLIKMKRSPQEGPFQWWGVDGLYFMAIFLNERKENIVLSVKKDKKYFSVHHPVKQTLAPGRSSEQIIRFYVGPKNYKALADLDMSLQRAVNFGFFGSLGKIIHKSLFYFFTLTHNYGWAIIILTFCIQILVFPLTVKSFHHSQKMKAVQPQMKKIQEQFKNDRQRLNTEMMHLYKKHGMKFMGLEGCLPMLVQLPIFFALYTTLRNAYELRHAPWILWVKDLSAYDPFYVLPILMGLGMLLQQKMTMSTADPTQARMMYILPIVFIFIFLKMPSGLVLYWLTNSMLTIIIQLFLLKKQAKA